VAAPVRVIRAIRAQQVHVGSAAAADFT